VATAEPSAERSGEEDTGVVSEEESALLRSTEALVIAVTHIAVLPEAARTIGRILRVFQSTLPSGLWHRVHVVMC
jgi:hypothetical protein